MGTAELAGLCLIGYLIGSIPIGWLAVKWRDRRDLRVLGTGNVGTANIYRNVGGALAVLVGPVQFAQGLVPVVLAHVLGAGLLAQALVGLCALLGNGWPVWLKFNGGRGIAVSTGVVAGLDVRLLLVLLALYLAGLLVRKIAVGVLLGFVALPVVDAGWLGGTLVVPLLVLIFMILLRRLEGISADARAYGDLPTLAARRLLLDERPGRPLIGPRSDLGL
ncbi:MAG TPA: glycerol-3-phosphate acyltransferase [Candidatus Dormibacteraeota bacterium]